jgi:hypothetical protein
VVVAVRQVAGTQLAARPVADLANLGYLRSDEQANRIERDRAVSDLAAQARS